MEFYQRVIAEPARVFARYVSSVYSSRSAPNERVVILGIQDKCLPPNLYGSVLLQALQTRGCSVIYSDVIRERSDDRELEEFPSSDMQDKTAILVDVHFNPRAGTYTQQALGQGARRVLYTTPSPSNKVWEYLEGRLVDLNGV